MSLYEEVFPLMLDVKRPQVGRTDIDHWIHEYPPKERTSILAHKNFSPGRRGVLGGSSRDDPARILVSGNQDLVLGLVSRYLLGYQNERTTFMRCIHPVEKTPTQNALMGEESIPVHSYAPFL